VIRRHSAGLCQRTVGFAAIARLVGAIYGLDQRESALR